MAQLGSGNDSSYPGAIDTRQFFQNVAAAVPDSSTRLDAEFMNDLLSAILAIETALGSNPQGNFGSLAARLNQFLPGGSGGQGAISFTSVLQVHVGGTQLVTGLPAVQYRIYNDAIPAASVEPGMVLLGVDQANYTMQAFFAQPQSGVIVTSSNGPQYVTSFSNVTTLSVPNSVHLLATAAPLFQLYDDQVPAHALTPNTFSAHRTTGDVTLTFTQPQSGTLVLSHLSPEYVHVFANVTSFLVAGVTHALGTRALLYQVYDNSTPAGFALEPASVTIHPVTFDVTVTFAQPQSGYMVLAVASTLTGTDFAIRDAGIPDSTAVQVRSADGNLRLQAGAGNYILLMERTGQIAHMTFEMLNGRLGLGRSNPTYQLELSTDLAAKLSSSTWYTLSDVHVKEGIRPFTEGLAVLNQLRAVWYRHNGRARTPRTGEEHLGLVAQDVQAVAPYMVREQPGQLDPGGPMQPLLSLNMHALWLLLINSVQELCQRMETLEADVQILKDARRNADRSLW
ncbi:MAG TPA: tail fiber domain-containing protein [Nitrospiraceae bacterium]